MIIAKIKKTIITNLLTPGFYFTIVYIMTLFYLIHNHRTYRYTHIHTQSQTQPTNNIHVPSKTTFDTFHILIIGGLRVFS